MASRHDYDRLIGQYGPLWDRMTETHDPVERARLLDAVAEVDQQVADIHMEVFGPDPIESEGGWDLAESHAHSARLLRVLADVERATDSTLRRKLTASWLEPCASPVLGRMACRVEIDSRAQLLGAFYEAVVDHVGGQAAETLACLPYAPGRSGWDGELYLPASFPKLARVLWRAWRERRPA
jgi:hypothetical protein